MRHGKHRVAWLLMMTMCVASAVLAATIHDEISWVKTIPGIKFMFGNGTADQWDDAFTVPPPIMEKTYLAIKEGALQRGWHLEFDRRGGTETPYTWMQYYRKGALELTINLNTAGDDDRMILVSVHRRE